MDLPGNTEDLVAQHEDREYSVKELEMLRRKRLVMRLKLRGFTYAEISERVGVTSRTVAQDVSDLRIEISRAVRKERKDHIVGEVLRGQEERVRLLWQRYEGYKDEPDKQVGVLRELREEEKEYWKRLQDLGVVHKAATTNQLFVEGENVSIDQRDSPRKVYVMGFGRRSPKREALAEREAVRQYESEQEGKEEATGQSPVAFKKVVGRTTGQESEDNQEEEDRGARKKEKRVPRRKPNGKDRRKRK